ncbi:hypothetical protein K523DRAFT_252747 [Schizophyllum commune Tattone D]|nr:hypothetical protein K523DRAFT_252747 [Schizophyllum commune Tattone D]
MVMNMKGHNGLHPCRMCSIKGLRIPGRDRVTTHYVPLDRTHHPSTRADPTATKSYDPAHLPSRSHAQILQQGRAVQLAPSQAAADRLSKSTGVKGVSILYQLPSIQFPTSFPYDFMHLIFENVIKNLIKLWTGDYKDIPEGTGDYQFERTAWDAIGAATGASGDTIPGVFGARPPDIAQDNTSSTADTWSFWILHIGPALLSSRFKRPVYYSHFISFVRLVNSCMKFKISHQELDVVRQGFRDWVVTFEKCVFLLFRSFLSYRNKHRRRAPEILVPKSFFGQLMNIYVVEVLASPQLHLTEPETVILARIHSCTPCNTNSLGQLYYKDMGRYEVVDIHTVQCLVGRVPRRWPNPDLYAILDRSSDLNHSLYIPDTN